MTMKVITKMKMDVKWNILMCLGCVSIACGQEVSSQKQDHYPIPTGLRKDKTKTTT